MAYRPIGPEVWAAIRRVWQGEALTTVELARLAGVSQRAIQLHAAEEGWTRPQPSSGGGGATKAKTTTKTKAKTRADAEAPTHKERALARLWEALDIQLAGLGEADAGRVATLTRTLEKLIEVERDMARERDAANPPADEGPEDIDEFRDEIARRLEALLGSRDDRSGGGGDPAIVANAQ